MILTTLHVDLGRQWRGGQNQALLLAAELRRLGHAAEIVAIARGPLAQRAHQLGIAVHEVAGRFQAALLLRRLRGFDVVHCHEPHALTSVWLAGVHRRTTCVVSRRVAYPIARLRYRGMKRIIAVSQFVKRSVVACGLPDDQVDVVYDGVPVPDSPPARGDGLLLGCVGWLLPEKGQELLIRAMPAVLAQHPSCRLVLAGDGSSRTDLEKLAVELGVSASLRFLGFVHDVDVVYRSLDAFLFPSLAEPLGSSLLAAMSYGLPCVGLASGAVPEVIEHNKNGLLVDTPDPAAFADAILHVLDDAALAARLGAAARQTVEERFSVAAMAAQTIELYRRLLRSQ